MWFENTNDYILLLCVVASIVVVLLSILPSFRRRRKASCDVQQPAPVQTGRQGGGAIRRVGGMRTARQRMHGSANQEQQNEPEQNVNQDNDNTKKDIEMPTHKMGAKKRAKLEAKAQKKTAKEVADREREDKKKLQDMIQAEKDRQAAKEEKEEKEREEVERKAKEEEEKRQEELYKKMASEFTVEEEGFVEEETEEENILQKFIQYVKENKIVVLEEVAAQFHIKTTRVIDIIEHLLASDLLTGVMDDRGKFIYITDQELENVAKFLRQRGRVTITELTENLDKLIGA